MAIYHLGKTHLSGARLYMQHQLTRKNFSGRLLEPCIPTLTESSRVADVACGTGAWSLEVTEEVSPVSIDCLDISLKDLPPPEFTTSNIKCRQFDLLKNLPDDMINTYDLVHVQFVMLFVKDDIFHSVMARIKQMLKPGGWIQWTDSDSTRYRWLSGLGSQRPREVPKLFLLAKELWGQSKCQWVASMGERFGEAGLRGVQEIRPKPQASTLIATNLESLWGLEEGFLHLSKKLDSFARERWTEQYNRAIEESETLKIGFDMGLVRAIGQKPY